MFRPKLPLQRARSRLLPRLREASPGWNGREALYSLAPGGSMSIRIVAMALLCGACASTATNPGPSPAPVEEGVRGPKDLPLEVRQQLTDLSPAELPALPADPTNRYADDP